MAPPPTNQTTAVKVVFKKSTVPNENEYEDIFEGISARLYNERNSFRIDLECAPGVDKTRLSAKLVIDSKNESGSQTKKPIVIRPGLNQFDTTRYPFVDFSSYVLKFEVTYIDTTYYSFFSHGVDQSNQNTPSYTFLYREDGGDQFSEDSAVTNPNDIENGSNIVISAPINVDENDQSRPHTVSFTFDEADNYDGVENDSDNTEQLVTYKPSYAYDPSGNYTLENIPLTNNRSYFIHATAYYSDGYVVNGVLTKNVNVITAPVINSITAYGLDDISISGVDQTKASAKAGDDTISTVMEVKVTAASSPYAIPAVNNQIRFNFKQNGTLMYSATKEVISVSEAVSGMITYTVLKDDLNIEWNDDAPSQNANGSYTYDVTAVIEYLLAEGDENIVKTSNIVTKDFTSDIIPLNEVTISNAWIAASVTTVDGQRMVDLTDGPDGPSANGYSLAPETAIAGQFTKHDYFGSGITDGFYQDLDKVDTMFKFEMSVNAGVWQPVQNLYLILGTNGASDQANYVALMSAVVKTNTDGLYSNPDASAFVDVLGSEQPDVYFMVRGPPQNPYQQTDAVKVRVQIITPDGETTWPSPTPSNEQIVVNKVNKYPNGNPSEPKFTGSGANGVLEIPINNQTDLNGDYYLYSATFESNLDAPNDSVTETVSQDGNKNGVFDLTVTNPSARGVDENINYTVYYKISDPNTETPIRGPVSDEYTIAVADEPTNANFTISDHSYKTFNDDGESSFEFKVSFQDGEDDTTIDGINVYFKSENDDSESSNNIPETLVATVSRYNSDGSERDADELISVTLQTTDPLTSGANDGVSILNINNISSTNIWLNYRKGTIVFRPYKTPKVNSFNDQKVEAPGNDHEENINNIPVIDPVDPASFSLTGGVIQSYNPTQVLWTNDLNKYVSASNVAASYELSVNDQDQTSIINAGSDSYTVGISGAASNYTVKITVKILADNDDVFYSEPTTLVFDSVSVQTSSLNVTVARGSNDTVLKASYEPLVVNGGDSDDLVVTSVGIVDNEDPENEDPEHEDVVVLTCTSTNASVHPPSTANTYNISSYALGDDIDAVVRVEAGVKYKVNGGEDQDSTPLYLELSAATNYVVAKKLSINIPETYTVNEDGDIVITLNINANGLWDEGLQGCFLLLIQDGDHTVAGDDDANGAIAVLQFDSSQAVTSYETQVPATTTSTDNMATGEPFELTDNNGNTYSLTLGTINSSDESVLTVPADADFDPTKSLTMVVVASTRLGLGHAIGTVDLLVDVD